MHTLKLSSFEPVISDLDKAGDDCDGGSDDGSVNKVRFIGINQLSNKGIVD